MGEKTKALLDQRPDLKGLDKWAILRIEYFRGYADRERFRQVVEAIKWIDLLEHKVFRRELEEAAMKVQYIPAPGFWKRLWYRIRRKSWRGVVQIDEETGEMMLWPAGTVMPRQKLSADQKYRDIEDTINGSGNWQAFVADEDMANE